MCGGDGRIDAIVIGVERGQLCGGDGVAANLIQFGDDANIADALAEELTVDE